MIRRDFLRSIIVGGTALAATRAAGKVIATPSADGGALARDPLNQHALPNFAANPFPLEDVTILDPELLRMRAQTLEYMLALDSDRLLHNFHVNAGLPSTADPLYNRESP